MKRILLFIVTFFISCNVYAIDLQVINSNGVNVNINGEEINIPFKSRVKLIDEFEGKEYTLVEYNNESVSIKKSDLAVVEDTFKAIDGIELEKEETIKIFNKSGLEIYKGPSKVFYDKLNSIIPVDTELTYKYVDSIKTDNKFAYVTYEGISGWVYLDIVSESIAKKENGKIMFSILLP